jgi:hypothetical protein
MAMVLNRCRQNALITLEMLVDEFASHRDSIASDPLRPNTDQGYEK